MTNQLIAEEAGDVVGARTATSRIAITIGLTIRKLRLERGLSLLEVGEGADVSASFVGALERGESDIAIGRLERIATFLGEDLGTILGYSRQEVRFNYVPKEDHVVGHDGPDASTFSCQVPGTGQQLVRLELKPGASIEDPIKTGGMVMVVSTEGTVQIVVADRLFHLHAGDCGSFAGHNPHIVSNETLEPVSVVLIASTNEH